VSDVRDDELAWRTATGSVGQGACVEVAPVPGEGWRVRDSKCRGGGTLAVSEAALRGLVRLARA